MVIAVGRAIAYAFAKEGADITISYFLVSKYVVPKFVNFLVKSKISTDTINKLDFLSCFLLIFILIKIYLL